LDDDKKVEWVWHIAPVVRVRVNSTIESWVFDPSVADRPLVFTDWLSAIHGNDDADWKSDSLPTEAYFLSKDGEDARGRPFISYGTRTERGPLNHRYYLDFCIAAGVCP